MVAVAQLEALELSLLAQRRRLGGGTQGLNRAGPLRLRLEGGTRLSGGQRQPFALDAPWTFASTPTGGECKSGLRHQTRPAGRRSVCQPAFQMATVPPRQVAQSWSTSAHVWSTWLQFGPCRGKVSSCRSPIRPGSADVFSQFQRLRPARGRMLGYKRWLRMLPPLHHTRPQDRSVETGNVERRVGGSVPGKAEKTAPNHESCAARSIRSDLVHAVLFPASHRDGHLSGFPVRLRK